MTKYIIFANSDDGYIDSSSTVHATARAGTGTKTVTNTGNSILVGQQKAGSTYHIFEAFLHFDTSTVPTTDIVAAANVLLKFNSTAGTLDPGTNHVYIKPITWVSPLDTTDYVSGATFQAAYQAGILASYPSVNGQTRLPIDPSNASDVVAGGQTFYVLGNDRFMNNIPPLGNEYTSVYSTESGTNGPVLLVYTFKPSGALAAGRACHQLSTGQTVELKGGPSKSSFTGDLVYYDKFTTTPHTIYANCGSLFSNTTSNPWYSPEVVDIIIDKFNTIYVIGPGNDGSANKTNIVMFRNTGGLTWAAPVIAQAPRDINGNTISIRADFINRVLSTGSIAGLPANVDYDQLIAIHSINEPVTSVSTVGGRTRIQIVEPKFLWKTPMPDTLTLIDITSPTWGSLDFFVAQPIADIVGLGRTQYAWGTTSRFAVATEYESSNGGQVVCLINVLKLTYSNNLGYIISTVGQETHNYPSLPLSLAADAELKMIPVGTSQACLFCGISGGNPVAILIDSSGNITEYGQSTLTTIPDSTLTGQLDAYYDPVTKSAWLYFLDTSTAGRISKVAFKVSTGVWDDTHSVIVTNSALATGTNVWLKLAKRTIDERTVHMIVENNNAGVLSHTVLTDSFNIAPNAPIVTAPPTFDATLTAIVSWAQSDPNTLDTQLKYEIEIDNNATSAAEWRPGAVTSTARSATIPAGTLTQNIVHRVRVRTYDEQNTAGTWSAYSTFSTSDIGSVSIDVPVDDLQIGAAETQQMTLSYHTSGAATISKYRVKTVRVSDSTILQDTGEVAASGLSITPTVRNLQSDVPIRFDVYIVNSAAQTTPTVSRLFTPSYLAPDQITNFTATVNGVQIDLSWVVPVPTGSRPAPDTIAVYRSDDGVQDYELIGRVTGSSSSFTDFIPQSGTTPVYYVVGETITGNTQSITASVGFFFIYGMALNKSNRNPLHPWDPPITLPFGTTGTSERRTVSSTKVQFQGRKRPVTEFGDTSDHTITAKAVIPFQGNPANGLDDDNTVDIATIMDNLEAILEQHNIICFRDSRGRKLLGSLASVDETDTIVGAEITIQITEDDYAESSF